MGNVILLIAGGIKLALPFILIYLWRKRTNTRFTPLLAGLGLILLVTLIRGAIRSGFDKSDFLVNFTQQSFLTSVLEEGCRFIAFAYVLKNFDRREDAVFYGIGHGFFESVGSGFATLNHIATDKAADLSIPMSHLFLSCHATIIGTLWHILMSVLMFRAVRNGKVKIYLPIAVFLHMFSNFANTFLPVGADIIFELIEVTIMFIVTSKLYEQMAPFDSEKINN